MYVPLPFQGDVNPSSDAYVFLFHMHAALLFEVDVTPFQMDMYSFSEVCAPLSKGDVNSSSDGCVFLFQMHVAPLSRDEYLFPRDVDPFSRWMRIPPHFLYI